MAYFFFFSSRRRHTRSKRDWSSDVCSSDLSSPSMCIEALTPGLYRMHIEGEEGRDGKTKYEEIGRASCRERVEIAVGAGSVKKKKEKIRKTTQKVAEEKKQ